MKGRRCVISRDVEEVGIERACGCVSACGCMRVCVGAWECKCGNAKRERDKIEKWVVIFRIRRGGCCFPKEQTTQLNPTPLNPLATTMAAASKVVGHWLPLQRFPSGVVRQRTKLDNIFFRYHSAIFSHVAIDKKYHFFTSISFSLSLSLSLSLSPFHLRFPFLLSVCFWKVENIFWKP